MTDFILTEKFSVASDFARALGAKTKKQGWFEGNGVVITWAVGHLVTLWEPEDYGPQYKKWQLAPLPLIPKTFEYKPIKQGYKQFKTIKDLLKRRSFGRLIVATDAGREGEVIARTILMKAGFMDTARMYRFWTSQALVPAVVRKGMEKLVPLSQYDRLWQAGYYRQMADWLIGMNCTRVLTVRLKDLYSVGRVQTAVLALLTDRKRERDDFTPQPYWQIRALFSNEKGQWEGLGFKGKETRIHTVEEARERYHRLSTHPGPGRVETVRREEKQELPPLLFSLTDLQQLANRRLGFSAKKTLGLAQSLYQDRKCLSYPRTDSRVLGRQNLDLVKGIIEKLSAVQPQLFQNLDPGRVSLKNKRVFNDARLTDHHALIPVKPIPASAGSDEKKLFDLVLRRFAAAFHRPCRLETLYVETQLAGENFQSRGRVILEPGWRHVWQETVPKKEDQGRLPPLAVGDGAQPGKIRMEEKQTQPPPAYTDALLLKDMSHPGRYVDQEELKRFFRGEAGLGTQSTRAQIIETLITRQYIRRAGKQLEATAKGAYLVDQLRRCPASGVLTSAEETARWEMALNRIALGEDRGGAFMPGIEAFVKKAVAELKTAELGTRSFGATDLAPDPVGRCPACGQWVKEGRKAYNCEAKDCDLVIWKTIAGKKISPAMAGHLLKYGQSGPYKGFYSKKKKRFSASLVLKEDEGQWQVRFDFAKKSGKKPAKKTGEKANAPLLSGNLDLKCPLCGGPLIEGQKGVGCAHWRPGDGGCRFVIWKVVWGKALTEKNMETLVAGKTTRPYVFKTGSGEKYKAGLKLEAAGEGAVLKLLPREGKVAPRELACSH